MSDTDIKTDRNLYSDTSSDTSSDTNIDTSSATSDESTCNPKNIIVNDSDSDTSDESAPPCDMSQDKLNEYYFRKMEKYKKKIIKLKM